MSADMWIMWIIVAFLWTVLVCVISYLSGLSVGRQEAKEEDRTYAAGPPGPVGPMGVQGPPGPPGEGFTEAERDALQALWQAHLSASESGEEAGLQSRVNNLEGRMTRVERRAGMSV